MIDFPNAPTVGQVVSSPSGTAWRWTGSTWLLGTAASAGGARGTVAYSAATANQGGITNAEVTLTGLSVSAPLVAGRSYSITTYVHYASTVAADRVILNLYQGATVIKADDSIQPTGAAPTRCLQRVVTAATTGTQNFSVTMQRLVGTGTLQAVSGSTDPCFILVEDITYDAGPGGAAGGGGFASLPVTVNADQTGFTTANADMTGFATTINVIDRRLYEVTFLFNTSQNATGGYQTINMVFGATAITVSSAWVPATAWIMHSGAVQFVGGASTGSLQGVPVGATVIKMQGRTNGGIMTVNSGSIVNGRFAVKDVGPVPN